MLPHMFPLMRPRTARRFALLAVAGLPACASPADSRDGAGSAQSDSAWVTAADRSRLLAAQALSPLDTSASSDVRIEIDTTVQHQRMTGFGAALTDASAWVLHEHLDSTARERLLQELFSPDSGIGLSFVRVPIGASDFSRTHYSLDDAPTGARDTAFIHFSLAPDTRLGLPLLRRIRAINPRLSIMATPWSAPAWMKEGNRLSGGTLRAQDMRWYAEYIMRALKAYDSAGVGVTFMSMQNEPHHEPGDYPGMRLDAGQRARLLSEHLGPMLSRTKSGTRVIDWDHNWDDTRSTLTLLADARARKYVHGVAWHCYAGDVSAQSVVHDRYPDIATYFTECSGGAWAPNFGDNLLWNVRTLVVGATEHWASGVMLWNLALDERHGPHLGGCKDCRGVVTIDSASGTITRNEEYYALAHASRFVRPGAVRLASLMRTDSASAAGASGQAVSQVAFRNEDDSSIVLIAVNSDSIAARLHVSGAPRATYFTMPARSVATLRWMTRPRP